MGLFKKNVLILSIFLLHTYAINAKLTKSEERQAMLLKNHLRRLAFRSQYKPLPATAQTRVESIVKKLEDFDKKDPESHAAEQVQKFVKAIKYETPSAVKKEKEKEITEERKEKPPVKPSVQESAAAELLKKQDAALNEFIEHLLLLQNTQETWKENKPIDSWKEKVLELLKKPELFDITLENNLNVPSALLDALINRYNYFIWSAYSQDKQEEANALKVIKTEYINTVIKNIFGVYVTQLYQPGAFWNAQTQTIDKVWQNEVLNFLCYALRIDFSDQRLKILQEAFNKVITEKYTKENVTATEQLETAKNEAANFLKKCQENLGKRSEALKEQQSESNFETLMNIIASARSATSQEKEQHEQQALVQAISWIRKVPSDELNTVVNKIKKMYRDALHTQVKPWYAWAGMYTGNEETAQREQAFNTKLNAMIEDQLKKTPARQTQQPSGVQLPGEGEQKITIPVPPAPPASEQPQVPASAQAPSEQVPGQQAPPVSPGVQPPATGPGEQAQAQVPQPKEKTEEEKLALLKQYINTLTTKSIDIWKVGEDDWDAVIKGEWLNGLLKICKDNGIPINENILTLLQERMGKDNWFSVIRNTYIVQKSFERLQNLQYEAEQKATSATKTAQINKEISDYIATLKKSDNWGFAEGQHQIRNEWLAGLFNILKKNANIFSKEELEKLLRTTFAELPADIKVQNPAELIKKVVDNIEQNINAYKKVYLEELGSPSGLKYNYQGL